MHLPPRPWIVGHRGAAGEAPENTLPSFQRALEQGVAMIELDVQLASDGSLPVVHDWDLLRLTGEPWVVEETPRERWRRALVQGPLPGIGAAPIPTLGEVLAALPERLPLNVELKRRRADRTRLCEAVLAATAGREAIVFSSFDHTLLAELRRRSPDRRVAPLAESDPSALLRAGETLDAWALHADHRMVTPEFLAQARLLGWPVLAYTVNDRERAQHLVGMGVDGLFTDHPGRLRGLSREPPALGAKGSLSGDPGF